MQIENQDQKIENIVSLVNKRLQTSSYKSNRRLFLKVPKDVQQIQAYYGAYDFKIKSISRTSDEITLIPTEMYKDENFKLYEIRNPQCASTVFGRKSNTVKFVIQVIYDDKIVILPYSERPNYKVLPETYIPKYQNPMILDSFINNKIIAITPSKINGFFVSELATIHWQLPIETDVEIFFNLDLNQIGENRTVQISPKIDFVRECCALIHIPPLSHFFSFDLLSKFEQSQFELYVDIQLQTLTTRISGIRFFYIVDINQEFSNLFSQIN